MEKNAFNKKLCLRSFDIRSYSYASHKKYVVEAWSYFFLTTDIAIQIEVNMFYYFCFLINSTIVLQDVLQDVLRFDKSE